MSMFSWVKSCCSSAVLFWMPFTLICSILSCLFLGYGLFVAEVCVCGGALSVLLVRVVFVGCCLLRIVCEGDLELFAWFWFCVVMCWVQEVVVGSDLFAAGLWWCFVCGR